MFVSDRHFEEALQSKDFDLLRRPLEPVRAISIDPPGTIEVDDAISVQIEEAHSERPIAEVTTYIADTALYHSGVIFDLAEKKGFTNYDDPKAVDYMLPRELIEKISLGNDQQNGSAAIAVRYRVGEGKIVLEDISRVRVMVETHSYSSFKALVKAEDPLALDIVRSAKLIQDLGIYTLSSCSNSKAVVAPYMVATNNLIAEEADNFGLDWIWRSFNPEHSDNRAKKGPTPRGRYTHLRQQHLGISKAGRKYCHFTSPMRRLPDFAIHKALSDILDNKCPFLDGQDMEEIAHRANFLERQNLAA